MFAKYYLGDLLVVPYRNMYIYVFGKSCLFFFYSQILVISISFFLIYNQNGINGRVEGILQPIHHYIRVLLIIYNTYPIGLKHQSEYKTPLFLPVLLTNQF